MVICLVIISEWPPLSHRLLWFWWTKGYVTCQLTGPMSIGVSVEISSTIQTISTNSLFVARQNSPITSIDTEFMKRICWRLAGDWLKRNDMNYLFRWVWKTIFEAISTSKINWTVTLNKQIEWNLNKSLFSGWFTWIQRTRSDTFWTCLPQVSTVLFYCHAPKFSAESGWIIGCPPLHHHHYHMYQSPLSRKSLAFKLFSEKMIFRDLS